MKNNIKILIVAVVVALVFGVGGFFIGNKMLEKNTNKNAVNNQNETEVKSEVIYGAKNIDNTTLTKLLDTIGIVNDKETHYFNEFASLKNRSMNSLDSDSITWILKWYLYEHNIFTTVVDSSNCYDTSLPAPPARCYEVELSQIDKFLELYDFKNYNYKNDFYKVTDTKTYMLFVPSAGMDIRSHTITSWYSDTDMEKETTTADYITIRDEFVTVNSLLGDRTTNVIYFHFKKVNNIYKLIFVNLA